MELNLTPFIGLPYEHGGRSYEGADCMGLAKLFYRDVFGIEVPDYRHLYSANFDLRECGTAIEEALGYQRWVPVPEPSFGSLLLFRVMGVVSHVGIYLADDDFLHAFQGTNSCIESLTDPCWNKRWVKTVDLCPVH